METSPEVIEFVKAAIKEVAPGKMQEAAEKEGTAEEKAEAIERNRVLLNENLEFYKACQIIILNTCLIKKLTLDLGVVFLSFKRDDLECKSRMKNLLTGVEESIMNSFLRGYISEELKSRYITEFSEIKAVVDNYLNLTVRLKGTRLHVDDTYKNLTASNTSKQQVFLLRSQHALKYLTNNGVEISQLKFHDTGEIEEFKVKTPDSGVVINDEVKIKMKAKDFF